jgi:hypothetical protein
MSHPDPSESERLSKAIAEARSERPKKTNDLDRFRAVLLKEKRAGASVRALKEGLTKIGVEVSAETLRTWLLAQDAPKQKAPAPSPKVPPVAPARRKPIMPSPSSVPPSTPTTHTSGPRVARDDI